MGSWNSTRIDLQNYNYSDNSVDYNYYTVLYGQVYSSQSLLHAVADTSFEEVFQVEVILSIFVCMGLEATYYSLLLIFMYL